MVAGLDIILYNIIYIFLQRSPMFFSNFIDYSMYIYYFSKPWGCFVCICMCVILFIIEAVCVFVCMHVDVCGLGTLGCVGRVG